MKKIFCTFILLAFYTSIFSQNNTIPRSAILDMEMYSTASQLRWMVVNMTSRLEVGANKFIYEFPMDMGNSIKEHIDTLNVKDDNYRFLSNNQEVLSNMMNNICSEIGDDIILLKTNEFPICLTKYKNNAGLLLFNNFMYPSSFNTLRTNYRQRAAQIISTLITPGLDIACIYEYKPSVKYIGMGVVYGAKDFSNDSAYGVSEVVYMVSSIEDIKKYHEGILTEDDLVEGSDIWVDSENSSGLKKVKIKLE